MMLIQILLLAILAAALVLAWRRAGQGALSRTSAILWSILWVGAGVVVLRPEVASLFAGLIGVGRGVDAIVYFAIIFIFYLVFRIFLRLEKLDRDITALIRALGLSKDGARGRDGAPDA